jgi:hypothetical protein
MADVPCRCADEACGHANGERCGKPITVKLKASVMLEPEKFTPEFETGVCDDCWERIRERYGFGK